MAAYEFSYHLKASHTGLVTICQFKAPTNQRVEIVGVEVMPFGASGATAPLEFDVGFQDGDGTANADNGNLVKKVPAPSIGIQTTVRANFTVEPSNTTPANWLSLHQMGGRSWVPLDGPIIIEANMRCALRYITAVTLSIGIAVHLRE